MSGIDKDELVADNAALTDYNRGIVAEFRANAGTLGGPYEGSTWLLLHTTGAKSGKPRLSPLMYLIIGGKMFVVGAYAGAPNHPAWVHNLRSTPQAHIEIGDESYDVDVREVPDEERGTTFAKIVDIAPVFADYQAKTTRVIPLFELTRSASHG